MTDQNTIKTLPLAAPRWQRAIADVEAMAARITALEQERAMARAELEHVLSILPFENAKTGKYRKLRKRLERFLSDRIEGL